MLALGPYCATWLPYMKRRELIKASLFAGSALAGAGIVPVIASKVSTSQLKVFTHGQYTVLKLANKPGFFFKAGMAIDADGAPSAYHPKNKGIDGIEHAGEPGNWWALVTDNGKPDGKPVVQSKSDPYPGYYISATALYDETKKRTDPKRYVDSSKIPYVVLPQNNNEEFLKLTNIKLGDFAVAYNTTNRKLVYAIFADTSLFFAGGIEEYRFGEGSIALANALSVPSNPRHGGVQKGLFYVFFPGSGNGKPRTIAEINREGAKLFKQWGGIPQIIACLK